MGSFARCVVGVIGVVLLSLAVVIPTVAADEATRLAPQDFRDAAVVAWIGVDERPLPFTSDAQIVDFLQRATVVSTEKIPVGTTEPRKVLLDLDGVQAHAVFRDVDVVVERVWLNDGSFHMKLRDFAGFEVAAYRLARLLGLDNVPPAVARRIGDTNGSLQLWVEKAMTEEARRDAGAPLPDRTAWFHRFQAMFLFDYIIGNVDRNLGNYLTDDTGKLWMIDHTRAFQQFLDDSNPLSIGVCQRRIWERLQGVDAETLRASLGDVLAPGEINALAKRLDTLTSHLWEQIRTRGEHAVIIDTS